MTIVRKKWVLRALQSQLKKDDPGRFESPAYRDRLRKTMLLARAKLGEKDLRIAKKLSYGDPFSVARSLRYWLDEKGRAPDSAVLAELERFLSEYTPSLYASLDQSRLAIQSGSALALYFYGISPPQGFAVNTKIKKRSHLGIHRLKIPAGAKIPGVDSFDEYIAFLEVEGEDFLIYQRAILGRIESNPTRLILVERFGGFAFVNSGGYIIFARDSRNKDRYELYFCSANYSGNISVNSLRLIANTIEHFPKSPVQQRVYNIIDDKVGDCSVLEFFDNVKWSV